MHYYEHHLGDYAEATAHLSFVEDAAYSRMIRKYYATEKPLPAEKISVQRLIGARTKEEREAVSAVLEEFFELREDGWHNTRCDEEIARFQDKQAKAKRSAEARWNKLKSHTEGNANASPDAMRTHSEGNAHQAPSTKHQAPEVNLLSVAAASESDTSTVESRLDAAAEHEINPIVGRSIELVALLVKRGAAMQASDPRVRRWAEMGVTDAQALQALEIAQQRREQSGNPSAVNAGYIDSILPDVISKPKPKPREPAWWSTESGIIAKGRELGIDARIGESMPEFKARINAKIAIAHGATA